MGTIYIGTDKVTTCYRGSHKIDGALFGKDSVCSENLVPNNGRWPTMAPWQIIGCKECAYEDSNRVILSGFQTQGKVGIVRTLIKVIPGIQYTFRVTPYGRESTTGFYYLLGTRAGGGDIKARTYVERPLKSVFSFLATSSDLWVELQGKQHVGSGAHTTSIYRVTLMDSIHDPV